jgi:uncharacterized membrane protein
MDHSDHDKLTTERLEAFSDGVFAIIITITVLELKIPEGSSLSALAPLVPLFIAYAISFQTVGTYWNNHHHLLRATKHVSAGIMWANLNLLFWLSLIPFTTGWLGANHGGAWPTALYAGVLLAAAISYSILQTQVIRHAEHRAELIAELNKSKKGLFSLVCYLIAIPSAFVHPLISDAFIFVVTIIWFIPDSRIAKFIA